MRKKRFVKDLVKFSKGKSILSEVNLENHETQFEMHKIFNRDQKGILKLMSLPQQLIAGRKVWENKGLKLSETFSKHTPRAYEMVGNLHKARTSCKTKDEMRGCPFHLVYAESRGFYFSWRKKIASSQLIINIKKQKLKVLVLQRNDHPFKDVLNKCLKKQRSQLKRIFCSSN